MNWKDYAVEANNWEEALAKWERKLTVGEEERRKEASLNANDYTVKIEGNKTIVTTKDGKVGVARCNPEDTFDIVEGIRVALEDIKKKYRKLTKEELAIIHYLQELGCDELQVMGGLIKVIVRGSNKGSSVIKACVIIQDQTVFEDLCNDEWISIAELLERNK